MTTKPISIREQTPEENQAIMGRSDTGYWFEYWNSDEPIGIMLEWKDASKVAPQNFSQDQTEMGKVWNSL